jgi:hypothetical protein
MSGRLLDQPEAHNEWWVESVPALTVLDVITPEHEEGNPEWVDSDWTPHPGPLWSIHGACATTIQALSQPRLSTGLDLQQAHP